MYIIQSYHSFSGGGSDSRLTASPLVLVLLVTEALVVVSLRLEQLKQMRLTVVLTLKRGKISQFKSTLAVLASEASAMERFSIDVNLLHGIDSLRAN